MLRKTASLMNYVQVLLICSVKCRLVLLCLFFNVLLGNLELDLFCLLWMHIHILFYQPKIADWLFAHVSELIRVSLVVLTCFSFVVYAVALLLQTDWNPWYIMLLTLYGCIEYDLWSIDIEILYFLCDCDISVLLIAHTVFGCYTCWKDGVICVHSNLCLLVFFILPFCRSIQILSSSLSTSLVSHQ